MTDKEIIKALETCLQIEHIKLYCCDKESKTTIINITDIRDLINRQQAEIEQMKEDYERATSHAALFFDRYYKTKCEKDNLIKTYAECQVDFLKEFVEKLKRELDMIPYETAFEYQDTIEAIDNLVKEMVGADNGN